jgi:hypothetical protein
LREKLGRPYRDRMRVLPPSERYALSPAKALQTTGMSEALRNRLWNTIDRQYS